MVNEKAISSKRTQKGLRPFFLTSHYSHPQKGVPTRLVSHLFEQSLYTYTLDAIGLDMGHSPHKGEWGGVELTFIEQAGPMSAVNQLNVSFTVKEATANALVFTEEGLLAFLKDLGDFLYQEASVQNSWLDELLSLPLREDFLVGPQAMTESHYYVQAGKSAEVYQRFLLANKATSNPSVEAQGSRGRLTIVAHRKGLELTKEALTALNLPSEFSLGEAVDDGGCFFDGLAQVINARNKNAKHDEASLRQLCHQYYFHHDEQKEEVGEWLKKESAGSELGDGYGLVQYTAREMERHFKNRPPIWGRPHIEGVILCRQLNLSGISIIEVISDPESDLLAPSYIQVTQEGVNSVNSSKFFFSQPCLIVSQKELHFVPLLSREALECEITKSSQSPKNVSSLPINELQQLKIGEKYDGSRLNVEKLTPRSNDIVIGCTSKNFDANGLEKCIKKLPGSVNTRYGKGKGSTPLIYLMEWFVAKLTKKQAIKDDDERKLSVLLNYGASWDIKNIKGKSARDIVLTHPALSTKFRKRIEASCKGKDDQKQVQDGLNKLLGCLSDTCGSDKLDTRLKTLRHAINSSHKKNGDTPLIYYVRHLLKKVVNKMPLTTQDGDKLKVLLKYGASLDKKNNVGESARQLLLSSNALREKYGKLFLLNEQPEIAQNASVREHLGQNTKTTVNLNQSPKGVYPAQTESAEIYGVMTSGIPGLKLIKVPGDGHCLYNAVALYVGKEVSILRGEVAHHINCNFNEFCGFLPTQGLDINQYIDSIREGTEWASHVEIEILMRFLERAIVIVDENNKIQNLDGMDRYPGKDPIYVRYNGTTHYDGLVLDGSKPALDILRYLRQLSDSSTETGAPPMPFGDDRLSRASLFYHQSKDAIKSGDYRRLPTKGLL